MRKKLTPADPSLRWAGDLRDHLHASTFGIVDIGLRAEKSKGGSELTILLETTGHLSDPLVKSIRSAISSFAAAATQTYRIQRIEFFERERLIAITAYQRKEKSRGRTR